MAETASEEVKAAEQKATTAAETKPELDEKEVEWMQQALQVAQEGLHLGEVPVGAIFVNEDSGEMVARSHNLTT